MPTLEGRIRKLVDKVVRDNRWDGDVCVRMIGLESGIEPKFKVYVPRGSRAANCDAYSGGQVAAHLAKCARAARAAASDDATLWWQQEQLEWILSPDQPSMSSRLTDFSSSRLRR